MNTNTRVVIDIPATAASPNFPAATFSMIAAITDIPCLKSDGSPVVTMSMYVPIFLDARAGDSTVVVFFLMNMESRIEKLMTWLTSVAIAAPLIPRSSTNMKSGSSAMFMIPPAVSPTIARFAFP